MAVTKEEMQDFNRFVEEKLSNGGAESLIELARQWEELRESEETIADILESEADIEAGRVHPAEEVFDDVRRKLGLTE